MGKGFEPPTVEEVFGLGGVVTPTCGACGANVNPGYRERHIDWHRQMGDPVFAQFHTQIGLRRQRLKEE